MPLVQTRGAASAQGFGEFAQVTAANYIEDVFSTYLYTGNGATQTITNGIDLSTKGGLVWCKSRSDALLHELHNSATGVTNALYLPDTSGQSASVGIGSFNTNGFTLGNSQYTNQNASTYVSWTFRKQPKFFDVVTYTGDGTNNRQIAHNLQSVPGFITTKSTSTTGNWVTWHRSYADTTQNYQFLNLTTAVASFANVWGTQTSTFFTVGTGGGNDSGVTYVAYLFAHNAGGFGTSNTDNAISCGTFTTDGSGNATVSLGYEPQWVLYKGISGTGAASDWILADTMRGYALTGSKYLAPNQSQTEGGLTGNPTATGFVVSDTINTTWIYIAIRRGPMKVPTLGTSVFSPVTQTDGGTVTTNFPTDLTVNGNRTAWGASWFDRLRGGSSNSYAVLQSWRTVPESSGTGSGSIGFDNNTGYRDYWNNNGIPAIYWSFRRAPGFFDEVCYTGTGSSQNVAHNLAVVPELLIIKRRNSTGGWEAAVPSTTAGSFFVGTSGAPISLNTTNGNGGQTAYAWASNTGTSTYFNPSGIFWNGNVSSGTYVAYLFATCAGVSKVGSYTGTGTTQVINCGFTAGSRFVMIKRTDSTGDWYVWDSARGIIAGDDPYLLINSTAAEVTNTDYVDTASSGFEISSTAPAAINANGGTFIFLAIA